MKIAITIIVGLVVVVALGLLSLRIDKNVNGTKQDETKQDSSKK